MSVREVARAEHRPVEQVEPILQRLAGVKRAIASSGPVDGKKYRLMPIMPGIFEMVLIDQLPQALSPWYRRFAELFEALYETGYIVDYQHRQTRPSPYVRALSVGRAIEAHPMALPSDYLEVILDRFTVFGVGQCQCRMTMQVSGQGCGKPVGNCTAMGQWAEQGIQQGWLKAIPRQEVLAIKREAEAHGLVTWILNVESSKGQASCSCCGCCCHALRMVNEFNCPGVIAPAHFLPQFDETRCTFCGKCARSCPMGALVVDAHQRNRKHLRARCIGCGLCALACNHPGAVVMEPIPDYQLPYKSWFAYQFRATAEMFKNAWKAWRRRS
jgi:Pyruvate/2-oxoacid:ferredoxin oxidoreductase delta subunit